jgi:hypothetical protein
MTLARLRAEIPTAIQRVNRSYATAIAFVLIDFP